MAITTKRLFLGELGVEALMPRKGGLKFHDYLTQGLVEPQHVNWVPDTADLHVLLDWISREIELREIRAQRLVSVAPRKPKAASRKPKGSVVPIQVSQTSQQAVNVGKAVSSEARERAPWLDQLYKDGKEIQ